MNIVAISGSIIGSKTRIAMTHTVDKIKQTYPEAEVTLLDLANYDLPFSDGRHYLDYTGDPSYVLQTIMHADAIIIGTPIFQASIPATLKNVFDLLPVNALRDKVVSIIVTAGSAKHYLIAEQQIKPILAYMKAHLVQSYVFIEEQDFLNKEIINDDVFFRIDRLIEDTIMLADTMRSIREEKEASYDF
ncbi:NADPH-dependent FMN reductase [Paraliobacillus salinarum]|uniref:NADPH-dependent FMN reductase n=1 Tax=Paraliobacillus salinarum TaxID=1158996 RepID=UPI0015F6387B|nr:NADPH-dependent FMN reductase [Paraliobacillus salinarum]